MTDFIVHQPDDSTPIKTPEEWAAARWDKDRQNPKTLDEARAALAARIAAHDEPEADTGAYDALEG
ncbi:hypothetical protein M8542_02465 [Amycolatopsis sp. OK19-0408]|uniref:Uncharacterized protein n=1 Tax=Amycolatopsis iheyensis TaxID=2945988 RepID=A0A9X2N6Z8_9PSEU|nr:hypothetical protein [Amycolatopsis iheyensis]MCR6481671.1 hypothetical protein [Amycolatopsis iheyensis]